MIHFLCPNCRKSHKADDLDSGKKCRCKHCNLVIDIPGTRSTSPTVSKEIANDNEVSDQSEHLDKSAAKNPVQPISNSRLNRKRLISILLIVFILVATGSLIWLLNNQQINNVDKQIVQPLAFQPQLVKSKRQFIMHKASPVHHSKGERTYLCEEKSTDQNRGNKVTVLRDSDSYDKWLKSTKAGDKYGLQELLDSGSAVEIEPQTECLMLGWSAAMWSNFRIEVRVIEGPHDGKIFFIDGNYFCETEEDINKKPKGEEFGPVGKRPPPIFGKPK
jgi:hypothetical protein